MVDEQAVDIPPITPAKLMILSFDLKMQFFSVNFISDSRSVLKSVLHFVFSNLRFPLMVFAS